MTRRLWLAAALLAASLAALLAGPQTARAVETNPNFKPEEEFELPPWLEIKVGGLDLSINKAVFFVLLACTATILFFWWTTRRLENRPDGKQTVLEVLYDFMVEQLGKANLPEGIFRFWFPYVATLFVFIWFNNMLGFVPLPVDTQNRIAGIPQLAIYSATANLSIPLALTLVSWSSYHIEGIRHNGLIKYLKSWVPPGVPAFARPIVFGIEVISHFLRLVSLSVRLFANMLAGHLLILMMVGMIVLLESVLVGVLTIPVATGFYLLEVVLIASLQAFIFSVLSAIYLGEAVATRH